jgi:RNA polymerase sigma-70 factor (ECF subfamily)
MWADRDRYGLSLLRHAVLLALRPTPVNDFLLVAAVAGDEPDVSRPVTSADRPDAEMGPGGGSGAVEAGTHTGVDSRIVALVELAKKGDSDAFGQLYEQYLGQVYKYVYYRVGNPSVAEDLTSEAFFRALRSLGSFTWQGKDFGAWLTTIARNLTADHFKSGRNRLEVTTDEVTQHDSATEGLENDVITKLTNEVLLKALHQLSTEQQDCLVLRFLQGQSIAATAQVLNRSEGAIKQLQLRATRNLAKLLPEGLR